jgi:outer membrane murein-binding lipoprotein Lpp
MTADLQDASSEVSRDLSAEWLELSSRVRRLAIEAQARGGNAEFAGEAQRLCDHVERLHSDVEQLLASLRSDAAAAGPLETLPNPPPHEVEHANLEIQDEMHQKSDLQHIIKALFMWKDDPVERARTRGE